MAADAAQRTAALAGLREHCLTAGPDLPAAERAFVLIERIAAERCSVARVVHARPVAVEARPGAPLAGAAVPA